MFFLIFLFFFFFRPVPPIFGQLPIIQFQQTMAFLNPYDGACATLKKSDFFYIKCTFPIFGLGKKISPNQTTDGFIEAMPPGPCDIDFFSFNTSRVLTEHHRHLKFTIYITEIILF